MGCNNYEDIGENSDHCGRYSPFNGGNFNDQGGFNSTSWNGVPVEHAKYVVDPRLQQRQDNIDNVLKYISLFSKHNIDVIHHRIFEFNDDKYSTISLLTIISL